MQQNGERGHVVLSAPVNPEGGGFWVAIALDDVAFHVHQQQI